MPVLNISENEVKELLDWPSLYEAIEQSLRAVCEICVSDDKPNYVQPTRIITPSLNGKGVLLTMPGCIGNYKLPKSSVKEPEKVFSTFGCTLVTAFSKNAELSPPKPNILGNIFLFDENSGELKAIIQSSVITAWGAAAASLVATNHLFLQRLNDRKAGNQPISVAIIGCGVQGRSHAMGICSMFSINSISLWNRTKSRAESLTTDLNELRTQFKNPNLTVQCSDTVAECVRNADIIVTSTFSSTPLVFRSMIKNNVHINAIGAGINHHSELSEDIYIDPQTKIYVDAMSNASSELKTLKAPIAGEVGDIINGVKEPPQSGIIIFHSMGMAIEDVAAAQSILEKYQNKMQQPHQSKQLSKMSKVD